MNPELRLEELNKTMAELQAEIAQAKADIAAAKAMPEPNIQDEAVNLDGGRGLTGNRDAEGNMITKKQVAVPEGFHEMEDGSIMADSEMEESNVIDAEMQKRIDDGTFGQKLGPIVIQKGPEDSDIEKDDFWKTQEGYDKAIEMYGKKPSWVKEPTMVYDAEANEYVEIKKEDKEEYEDLGISDSVKRMFG